MSLVISDELLKAAKISGSSELSMLNQQLMRKEQGIGNREQGGLSPIDNKKTLSYSALGRFKH